MLDPQQELFITLKKEIEKLGYSVYDGELPPEGTPYPFVYLDGFRQSDEMLKNATMGYVYPVIHVWVNSPRKRGTVSQMLFAIKSICYRIDETKDYKWLLTSIDQDIMPDNTTKKPLLHGVLEPTYKFS